MHVREAISYLKYGADILTDRLLGKIATVLFTIYASKLGAEAYAIHSICYGLAVFTESVTNNLYNYVLVKLSLIENTKKKYEECVGIIRRYFVQITLLCYSMAGALLIILHGEVRMNVCVIPLTLYCLQVLSLQLYECFKGYLTSIKRTDVMKYGGLVGTLVRVPIILISYYAGIGLIGFALACPIDFLCRGLYFRHYARRTV